MTVVVSANVGRFDTPKSHMVQSVPCRVVTITDGLEGGTARRAAKGPKLRPWNYTADDGPWIWLDAAFTIRSKTFVVDMLELVGDGVGMFQHPFRSCLYSEAAVLVDSWPEVAGQVAHYSAVGVPEGLGLWAAGVIVYGRRDDYLAAMWEAEIDRWSVRDQVSLPVVLARAGVEPVPLPGGVFDNRWLTWERHTG